MYLFWIISLVVYVSAFLIFWKLAKDKELKMRRTIEKQEKMLKKNLVDVKEEYARIFRQLKNKDKSAREIMNV